MEKRHEFLPVEELFELFETHMLHVKHRPKGWKLKEKTNDRICFLDSNNEPKLFSLHKKWIQQGNDMLSFPFCIVKRIGGMESYFAFMGVVNEEREKRMVGCRFDMHENVYIRHQVYLCTEDGTFTPHPVNYTNEVDQIMDVTKQVMSEDPKYRLYAVTGELFKKQVKG